MRSLKGLPGYIAVFVLACFLTIAGFFLFNRIRQFKDFKDNNAEIKAEEHFNNSIYIGESPLSDYVIVSDSNTLDACTLLESYIYKSTGLMLDRVSRRDDKFIKLDIDEDCGDPLPKITIRSGNITITGTDLNDLFNEINIFANAYLQFSFAGSEKEKLLYTDKETCISEDVYYNENGAWVPEREPIICLWSTVNAHGAYYNQNTVKKSELLSFSTDALYEYVKMMYSLGFTGIQVTDICPAWGAYGNYEFVHERIRFMADAAHSLGMNFTLWVWGSEFNCYGWIDRSVVYRNGDAPAYESSDVIDTYSKYYGIYSELADCCDRMIVHYYEPGHVKSMEEVAYFSRMFKDKVRSVNPSVNVGINVYSKYFELNKLCDALGSEAGDFSYYTLAMASEDDDLTNLRTVLRDRELNYGIWSWGVIEREIDQTAQFCVNAEYIQYVYNRTGSLDWILKPDYWSEMDSYHNINVFSLYTAGILLQNPELDPHEVLLKAAEAVVGKVHANELYNVLLLVEKARTGNTYETFYEDDERYVLLSDDYNADEILNESESAIETLKRLIAAEDIKSSIPLSVANKDILKMMLPHIQQIHDYASFKKDYDKLVDMAEAGFSSDEVFDFANAIFKPISEYNVVTGLWGQQEQRMQVLLMDRFCSEYGYERIDDKLVDHVRKQRILGEFISKQQSSDERIDFSANGIEHMRTGYGEETIIRLIDEMVEEGLLTRSDENNVFLSDWERYIYNF